MMNLSNKITFIAEAGVNHNGSVERALEMVSVASECGADFVKFQTFDASELVSTTAPLAKYQLEKMPDQKNQFQMLKSLELKKEDFFKIKSRADELGIGFLSTPFSISNLDFLIKEVQVDSIKISSGDITFSLLLVEAGKKDIPIIISTGMANINEIKKAITYLKFGRSVFLGITSPKVIPTDSYLNNFKSNKEIDTWFKENLTILHCTSEYPAPNNSLNLLAISKLIEIFGPGIGYSDHSMSQDVPIIAASLGAKVIEKHFTLSREDQGPDHSASIEPEEMKRIIDRLREVPEILGIREKFCTDIEVDNSKKVRRSLHASEHINIGSAYTNENIVCLRPNKGISASEYFNVIGKIASVASDPGEIISL